MTWRSLMRLLLPRDMAGDAARILDVLLPVQHLPDRARLRPVRVPHVHREDQRRAARIVLEDHFGRRVGENAAVPIELAVDAHRRKRGRQRAGRQDVVDGDRLLAAVEIAHHAGAHMRRPDREPWRAAVDQREVDQFAERFAQRRGGVEARAIGSERHMCAQEGGGVGTRKNPDMPPSSVVQYDIASGSGPGRKLVPDMVALDPAPEFVQRVEPVAPARCRRSGWR